MGMFIEECILSSANTGEGLLRALGICFFLPHRCFWPPWFLYSSNSAWNIMLFFSCVEYNAEMVL
jgi:hypothetical protein